MSQLVKNFCIGTKKEPFIRFLKTKKLLVKQGAGVLVKQGAKIASVSAPVTTVPVIPAEAGIQTIFHHVDHLSSGSIDTDQTGKVVELLDYFAFGETRLEEKTAGYENDYKYTGKEKDEDTGLYYYEARYYNSAIGRFISIDPWGGDVQNPQSFNKYSYVMNNPINAVDRNGLLTVFVHGTWSSSKEAFSDDYMSMVTKDLEDNDYMTFDWNGADSNTDRNKAAKNLEKTVTQRLLSDASAFATDKNGNLDFLKYADYVSNEPINIVGHSHGGNVAIKSMPKFFRNINNLVLLGTPNREDYLLDTSKANHVYNIYSENDAVMSVAGTTDRQGYSLSPWRGGDNVTNINIYFKNKSSLKDGINIHSALKTSGVWKKVEALVFSKNEKSK